MPLLCVSTIFGAVGLILDLIAVVGVKLGCAVVAVWSVAVELEVLPCPISGSPTRDGDLDVLKNVERKIPMTV